MASLPFELKHPVILPRDGVITHLILDCYHERTQHQGRGQTLNELRANGYWVVGAARLWQTTLSNASLAGDTVGQQKYKEWRIYLPVMLLPLHHSPTAEWIVLDHFTLNKVVRNIRDMVLYSLVYLQEQLM